MRDHVAWKGTSKCIDDDEDGLMTICTLSVYKSKLRFERVVSGDDDWSFPASDTLVDVSSQVCRCPSLQKGCQEEQEKQEKGMRMEGYSNENWDKRRLMVSMGCI